MKKLWRLGKGIFLLLILLGAILVRVIYMDVFMLTTIDIDASEHITEEVFREKTEIITHQNILRYNLEEQAEEIENHSYIKDATIRRKLPDTIEIKLKERTEYAIIPYNGSYLFVDRELFLLKISDSFITGEIPVLRDVSVRSADLGEKILTENDRLVEFSLEAYEALSVSKIFEDITEFYLNEDELIIETTEHIDIVFGTDIDLPYMVIATEEVYEDLLNRNQRNVSIVSKYKDYIYVESGTFLQQRQSKMDEAGTVSNKAEDSDTEEPIGDD